MSAGQDRRLTLRPDVVATVMEDGAVLLDLETKYFYQLNSTGWAIVQMFEAGSTPDEVVEQSGLWGSNGDHEVLPFIDRLLTEALLEDAGAVPGGQSSEPEKPPEWVTPVIEKQPEPLHKVMTSAFDPSLPLAE